MGAKPALIKFNLADDVTLEYDSSSDNIVFIFKAGKLQIPFDEIRGIVEFIVDIDFED